MSRAGSILRSKTKTPCLDRPTPANPVKNSLRLLIAAGFGLALAGLAQAADITGKWTSEFDSQIGIQKYVYTFKVDGEKLTGTASSERNGEKATVALQKGTVTKDGIFFVEPLNFDGQEVSIEYTGKWNGDNEIKFTRKVGDFATEEVVAKRVVEK